MAKSASTKLNIQPLGDRVVIEVMEEDTKTASGIVLPASVDKERPEQGRIVAVGPGKLVKGERLELEVKVGDTVLFTKYGPNEVKVGDKEYLIAREEDILAVIK
jgi:chaperonin GroES